VGMHRSEGATALLGMDGFVVGAQAECDGELWLMVETTADVVGCETCCTRAVGHGRREVKVRDLPIGDRRVVLVWHKRLWRCADADCDVKTWSEDTDAVAARAALTERARAEICRRVGRDGHAVAHRGPVVLPSTSGRPPPGYRGRRSSQSTGDLSERLLPGQPQPDRLTLLHPNPYSRHRPRSDRSQRTITMTGPLQRPVDPALPFSPHQWPMPCLAAGVAHAGTPGGPPRRHEPRIRRLTKVASGGGHCSSGSVSRSERRTMISSVAELLLREPVTGPLAFLLAYSTAERTVWSGR